MTALRYFFLSILLIELLKREIIVRKSNKKRDGRDKPFFSNDGVFALQRKILARFVGKKFTRSVASNCIRASHIAEKHAGKKNEQSALLK